MKLLRAYGEVLTEHVAAADLSALGESKDDRWIHDRDLAWLKEADCLVAEVSTPSLGVGFEIAKATEWASGPYVSFAQAPAERSPLWLPAVSELLFANTRAPPTLKRSLINSSQPK